MFALLIVCYSLFLLILAYAFSTKIETEEDFLVGGRKFNLWITSFCLFATWFGAGTLIAATDEVAAEGLRVTALEPYGAGFCLIFAGFFLAKPLWNLKLMTYSDLFKQRYGVRVELLSVFLNIPIYVGWIAVQYIALANLLHVFFPIPIWVSILSIASFTCILTVLGGMWSVSITDSIQMVVIIIGLFYLLFTISGGSTEGLTTLLSQVEHKKLILIPHDKWKDVFSWLSVFSIASLGNMTGQDLGQRMFSARSATIAQRGCLLAGLGYIVVGSIPVFLGLTAHITLGDYSGSVIPNLIKQHLDPITTVVLSLTILSAVVSTITSALLAPSSMLSHNFLKKYFKHPILKLSQYSVFIITILSVLTAFAGENVYSLLESSYSIGFVSFFVPVTIALYSKRWNEGACLITIVCSILIWLPELLSLTDFPLSLIAVLAGYPIYFICESLLKIQNAST